MRSRLIRLLILTASAIWLFVVYRITDFHFFGTNNTISVQNSSDSIPVTPIMWKNLHDVFQSKDAKPLGVVARHRVLPAVKEFVQPMAPIGDAPILKGVLAGEPPLVILDSSGKSEFVKAKSAAFGWLVVGVTDSGVMISKGATRRLLKR